MSGKFKKRLTSLILSFLMILTMIPKEAMYVFAATNLTITHFDYIQENKEGSTNVRVTIQGSNFIQNLSGTKEESVIKDIMVRSGTEAISLMQGADAKDVKITVTDNLITIIAPKTGKMNTLHIDTNGTSTVTITAKDGVPTKTYSFDVKVNDLPSMPGSLDSKKNYVGKELKINGANFTGVTNVNIAGASHEGTAIQVTNTVITIPQLRKGNLNKSEKIQFIKQDTTSNAGKPIHPEIKFTSEYLDKIIEFEKLVGMDNLEVLPSEGPALASSKITVTAKEDDKITTKKNVFNTNNELYLRRTDATGKDEEIKLTDVKLVREDPDNPASPVIAIEGWTPIWTKDVPAKFSLIVKDKTNPTSEGIKENAYTMVSANRAPQITAVSPNNGPDTGGTDVLIVGKNILNMNTPGISFSSGEKITPKKTTTKDGNETLKVTYDLTKAPNAKYGDKKITSIERKIKVRIATMTSANATNINVATNIPGPGDKFEGKDYGKFHYSTDGGDGLVVTTTNASTSGPQDVIIESETTFTLADGSKITIPEGTKYKSFTYTEKNPTPKVEGLELEYGFYNDSREEEEPPTGGNDGVKPLMLRIKGQKFEVLKKDGKLVFPKVRFVLPDNTVLPAESSDAITDTKVLDDKGNPIDGVYTTIGTTLVISVIPSIADKFGLRTIIGGTQAQSGGYKIYEAGIQITNPSGNHNVVGTDSKKFQFRRPVEANFNDENTKQPEIISVTSNGAPVKKLPSDADSTVQIRVKAVAGITKPDDMKLTVDGKDITKNIKSRKIEGAEHVITAIIPRGFIGKTRLQVIVSEGLMDSYQITFDNVRGPEIKELIPEKGEKGTFVVIKRDTQANEVTFKPPVDYPNSSEEERIGSKVLWNGEDISKLFDGYVLDNTGKVVPQPNDSFKEFKQNDKQHPAGSVTTPSKYVYVVDSDTIYLRIPDKDAIKNGTYNIQIKNPDGSESSIAKEFTIVDSIDKTKILSISPRTDDVSGGIIATIKAGEKDGIQTNFKGEVDVYFGSQKAEVVGYDIDFKEVYVRVPALKDFTFPKTLSEKVESYTVPVTVQNKINKSTDTVSDGFVYLNPNYDMKITQLYNEKYAEDPTNKEANKGVEGDYVIIRGENLRLEEDKNNPGTYKLPKVMFGHIEAQNTGEFAAKNTENGKPRLDKNGRAEIEWIKVKVPKEPTLSMNKDGSVDVLVQNPDGAKAVAKKGFIYKKATPTINEKASILQASRFHDTVNVNAKDVNPNGLIAAFGNKMYEKALSSSQMQIETTKEVEKIVVKYIPNTEENIEIYYKKPNGELVLMTDAENTNGGKVKLGAIGEKVIVGINWKNPNYHSTDITKNPDLIKTLNTEYMEISAVPKAPNVNALRVRRGLGKVVRAVTDPVSNETVLTIDTPYNDKSEKTTIELVNSDGSSAKAPFIFHGGITAPSITDIEGSKKRDVTVDGKPQNANVYTSDYSTETEITVIGEGFKDIQRVLVGSKEAEVISVSSDYKKIKIKVPAGKEEEIGVSMPITVVTKEGTGYSNKMNPPTYFMYIKAGSKPVLTSITPVKGPQTGGTKVTIMGTNFKDTDEFGTKGEIEIYFGGKKGVVNRTITNEKGEIIGIEATTAAVDDIDEKGTNVVVENADDGRSAPLPFRYISQPIIDKIEGNFELYAEAGDDDEDVKVTIIGKNFYNPTKLVIGANIVNIDKNKDNIENALMLGVKSDGSNQYVEVEKNEKGEEKGISVAVDSTDKSKNTNNKDTKTNNTSSFTVTIPLITYEQMKNMDGQNIFVINADGGVSKPMAVDIKLPLPTVPQLVATPGSHNTVGLSWELDKNDRRKPTKFEVYIKEKGTDNDYVHVGDVMANKDGNNLKYSHIIKNLKPNANYQVKLRVMNKFGEGEDFGYANVATLRKEDDYKQQEKEKELERATTNIRQNGTQKVVGNTLVYTVGTKENTINISGYNQKIKEIKIPTIQIKSAPNATIQIRDRNMALKVPFSAFNLNQVNSSSDDAVVVLRLQNADNKMNTKISKIVPKNKKRVSDVYKIDMYVAEPRKKLDVKFTSAPMNLSITPNKENNARVLSKYDEKTNKLQQNISPAISDGGYYVLLSNK